MSHGLFDLFAEESPNSPALRNVTLPHLASLLRHGTPIPLHGGQRNLLSISLPQDSELAGQSIAEIFDRFAELLAVAIIRDQQIQLPRALPCSRAAINY